MSLILVTLDKTIKVIPLSTTKKWNLFSSALEAAPLGNAPFPLPLTELEFEMWTAIHILVESAATYYPLYYTIDRALLDYDQVIRIIALMDPSSEEWRLYCLPVPTMPLERLKSIYEKIGEYIESNRDGDSLRPLDEDGNHLLHVVEKIAWYSCLHGVEADESTRILLGISHCDLMRNGGYMNSACDGVMMGIEDMSWQMMLDCGVAHLPFGEQECVKLLAHSMTEYRSSSYNWKRLYNASSNDDFDIEEFYPYLVRYVYHAIDSLIHLDDVYRFESFFNIGEVRESDSWLDMIRHVHNKRGRAGINTMPNGEEIVELTKKCICKILDKKREIVLAMYPRHLPLDTY